MSQLSDFDSVVLLAHDEKLGPGASGLILSSISAKPLTLDDWFEYEAGKPVTVELTGQVAEGSDLSSPGAPQLGTWVTRPLKLNPSIKSDTICLVEGGWVPLIYCMTGTNLFLDKNVVAEIKAKFDNGKLKPQKSEKRDFLHLLEERACSSVLNPLPFALEGNVMGLPDPETAIEQLHVAKADLAKALPHIKVYPEGSYGVEQVCATLASYQDFVAQGMTFLQKVGPLLMASPGKAKRKDTISKVIDAAHAAKLPLQHICVAVSLSALTASKDFNPAKKVLKAAHNYGPQEAYNAMWDLLLLEILHLYHTHHRGTRCALLTRDKNLAFMWMGMGLPTVATQSGEIKQTVMHERLMQCDADEMDLLQSLLGAGNFSYRAELHT